MEPTSVLPLGISCRSGQAWAWSLPQNCRIVKLPLLDCKCTLCATFCLPDLSCASSAARGEETQTQYSSRMTSEETNIYWWTIYCLPHPFEQRHYHRAVHGYKAHWWAPQHHADLPERLYGAKIHLAFDRAGDWALHTFCTAKLANSSSSWCLVPHLYPYELTSTTADHAYVQKGHATCLCNIYRHDC